MHPHPTEDFTRMRNRLLNDALLWISLAAIPGVIFSVARVVILGWRPLLLLHPILLAALWLMWFNRDRLSYLSRVYGLLAIAWLSTFAGLSQLGPVAIGGLHTILFSFIAILFLNGRLAAWLIGANALCLVFVGVAASRHWIEYNLDYQVYAHHPLTWLQTVWGLSAYSIILALIGWRMLQGVREREAIASGLAARQHKIAANVPGAIFQFVLRADSASFFPYFSDGINRLFGIAPDQLKESAEEAFRLVHPRDIGVLRQSIEASARDLTPLQGSFRVTHPGRGEIWLESNATPEHLDNGDTLWHGFLRDITALKVAEQRLTATLENTPNVAVQWYDRAGRVRYWNHASELIYGWTAVEAVGRTLDQLITTEAQTRDFLALMEDVEANGKVAGPSLHTVRHRDGSPRVVSSTVFPIQGGDAPIFVCMDIDMTEHKRFEETLKRYEFIANTIPDMMTLVGRDHRYEAVNDQWCRALDKPRESVMGRHLSEVWGGEVYRMSIAPRLERCFGDGAPQTLHAAVSLPRYGLRECEITYFPYLNQSGAASHAVVVTRDVTEKLASERELVKAKQDAEEANRAKSAFLASMSHELRTPLNAIIGFGQLLDMGIAEPLHPEQKEAVGHILNSGRHLLGLINEILDLARIEAGKIEVSLASVSAHAAVEEAVAMTTPLGARRGIAVQQHCDAAFQVTADPDRLRQILLNLLSNAVKYNREGGGVTISCETREDVVRIVVGDTGPGIPLERRAQLFQPFQRLGAERTSTEGTGIGLVISKKIAEAMGGSLGFESEVGVGSSFWLELPAAHETPSAAAVPTDHAATGHVQDKPVHGRVLYVEDNPVNLFVMKQVFRQLPDVELLIAESGEAGLDMIREAMPDLVLMDINLPGMSGLEALQAIKADPLLAATRVIAVSAVALPEDIESGLRAGFLGYLTKPFDVPQLIAQVRDMLRHRPTRESITGD